MFIETILQLTKYYLFILLILPDSYLEDIFLSPNYKLLENQAN